MRRSLALAAVSLVSLLGLSGCMWEVGSGGFDPGAVSLSGTIAGSPIDGTFTGDVSVSGGLPTGCGGGTLQMTMDDGAGNTLSKREWLFGCNGVYTGTYVVTGGTGTYAGATGGGVGTVTLVPAACCWIYVYTTEVGSLRLPGAPATRERRFTSRARVSVDPAVCRDAGGPAAASRKRCTEEVARRLEELQR